MADRGKSIGNLTMEINTDDLKKIVEAGKLSDFVNNASLLAAQEIRVRLMDELAKLALDPKSRSVGATIGIKVGYVTLDYDDYGTACIKGFCKRPRDFGEFTIPMEMSQVLANSVMKGMTQFEQSKVMK